MEYGEPAPTQTVDERLVVKHDAQETFNNMVDQQFEVGLETYGVPLQFANGRNAYADAVSEVTDLMLYLTQLQKEKEMMMLWIRRLIGGNKELSTEFYQLVSKVVFDYRVMSEEDEQRLVEQWK